MSGLLNARWLAPYLPLLGALAWLLGAIVVGLIVYAVAFKLVRRMVGHTRTNLDDLLIKHLRAPGRLLFPLFLVYLVLPALTLSGRQLELVRHGMSLMLIAGVAWTLMRLTAVATDAMESRYDIEAADNLAARRVQTQMKVFRQIVAVVIWVLAVGSMLMTFGKVRQLGTSILASAGIMGIVIGMAAQRALSNLIAGVQIAITQPIRMDDVVIVEGEWGRIEEITFTYVVVRIWDLRRLVLPISHFIEKPFQNWTRTSADILGTIELHLDYSIPLEKLREELKRLCEASPHWDKKVCGLQVTDATDRTILARGLISAADASKAWDLRCDVREGLLTFVQKNYPESLPRVRADLGQLVPAGAAPSPRPSQQA